MFYFWNDLEDSLITDFKLQRYYLSIAYISANYQYNKRIYNVITLKKEYLCAPLKSGIYSYYEA